MEIGGEKVGVFLEFWVRVFLEFDSPGGQKLEFFQSLGLQFFWSFLKSLGVRRLSGPFALKPKPKPINLLQCIHIKTSLLQFCNQLPHKYLAQVPNCN